MTGWNWNSKKQQHHNKAGTHKKTFNVASTDNEIQSRNAVWDLDPWVYNNTVGFNAVESYGHGCNHFIVCFHVGMSLLQVLQWNYESRTFTCNGVLIYYLLHVIVLVLLLKQRIWMLLPLHMVNKKVHASHKGWLQLHVLIHSKLIRNTSHLMDNLRIMMIMAEEIAQSNKWWRLLCRNISAVYRGVVHHHYCNMFSRFVLQIGSNECELCVCV